MIWLTWRQFRAQAVAVYAAVAAAAIVLAVTGPRLLARTRTDANVYDHLTRIDRDLFMIGIIVLAIAPAIIGAFWGAPMVARELESGTHRLVWNQSVTRTRWLATKLGITALAAALAVGALTLGITWWSRPIDGTPSSTHGGLPARITPVAFAMRGIAPVGYAVFALVLGVTAGIVLRRALPAMAVTLALFTFVQIAVPLWVRPHLIPPAQQTLTFSLERLDGFRSDGPGSPVQVMLTLGTTGDWLLSNQTVDASGHAAVLPSWFDDCLPRPPSGSSSVKEKPADGRSNLEACFTRLNTEGYRQHMTYQPASRFWALQWAETGLFLGLSALLAAFSFWWTRRRLS
jgi:hypothetical protein